jgi:hypothetical protein
LKTPAKKSMANKPSHWPSGKSLGQNEPIVEEVFSLEDLDKEY